MDKSVFWYGQPQKSLRSKIKISGSKIASTLIGKVWHGCTLCVALVEKKEGATVTTKKLYLNKGKYKPVMNNNVLPF